MACKYEEDIFKDGLTDDFYVRIDISWATHNFEETYDRLYINYCPWCGRKLGEDRDYE